MTAKYYFHAPFLRTLSTYTRSATNTRIFQFISHLKKLVIQLIFRTIYSGMLSCIGKKINRIQPSFTKCVI